MTPPGRRPRAVRLSELSAWASKQVAWIARRTHADRHGELFLYQQAAKLVEEVGELHAQLLGQSKAQRTDKGTAFDRSALEDEFADVLICTLILASVAKVDVAAAVRAKMDVVDRRVAGRSYADAGMTAAPAPEAAGR